MVKLVIPQRDLKQYCIDFIKEHQENNESDVSGDGGLSNMDFDTWLIKTYNYRNNIEINKNHVPSSTFLAYDSNYLVGIIDIRHSLNDHLIKCGGHIGYSIRPKQRRKGYAKTMLKLALDYCNRNLELSKVLITCDKDNIASRKTIISCGGVLENEIYDEIEKNYKLRFWVSTKLV